MTITEPQLREFIAGGESGTVEFKIKAPRPAELAERICGMANSRRGGTIIFGVADAKGAIVGLKDPQQTIDLALRALRMIRPAVSFVEPELSVTVLDRRRLVVASVPPNDGTLYQSSGVFWIRRGTHTVPMTGEDVTAHLYHGGSIRWERLTHPNATLDDLDLDRIATYLARRTTRRATWDTSSLEEALIGLECAVPHTESGQLRPTNAGLLMFGRDPQRFLPHTEVVCVRYADRLGVRRYQNRQNITGTLPELIDRTAAFLSQYIQVGAEIVGFTRIDRPEYPLEALREAVVNAVVHRDYSLDGETVRIFFYTDRVEVHSPGLLPPGIVLDELIAMRAPSRPRNVVLARLLRDMPGYMERMGAGIRFMVNEMRDRALPAPEFRELHEVQVIFRNGRLLDPDVANTLNARQLAGLKLIQEHGSISSRDYCEANGVSERTALRELRDLIEREIITVRGRTRSARYYLP